jgi:hypothetical protein
MNVCIDVLVYNGIIEQSRPIRYTPISSERENAVLQWKFKLNDALVGSLFVFFSVAVHPSAGYGLIVHEVS